MAVSAPLKGKIVLLTGAAGGIGLAAAKEFTRAGCQVAMVDIDSAQLDEARAEVAELAEKQSPPLALAVDITDDRATTAMIAKIVSNLGGIDILVNNAGLLMGGRFIDNDPAKLRKLVEVNLYAPLRLIQLVVPSMQERNGGHIVNVYSSAALLSLPGFAAYGATKAGLFAITRTLRRELDGTGIELMALCPGSTASAMTNKMVATGLGPGAQAHHSPEVPARAMVMGLLRHKKVVVVSSQPRIQGLLSFLDRLFPSMLHRFWVKHADDDFYDGAARGGR